MTYVTVTVVYLGHIPGKGAYGVQVDEVTSKYIVFRGTLEECSREAEKMGAYRR